MATQTTPTTASPADVYLPFASFRGALHEDVKDLLRKYDRVAHHNNSATEQRLEKVYFSLEGTVKR